MKKSVFLLPLAFFAMTASAGLRTPPSERREALSPIGVEFLQVLGERNQQADLIADKFKELLEAGNTIQEAAVVYRPTLPGAIYRRYEIRTLQCGHSPSDHGCIGGGKLIITKTGAFAPGAIPHYTTELIRFR